MSIQPESSGTRPAGLPTRATRIAALRGRYLRTVDSWIPLELQRNGGESLRCARIVVGLTLVLLILALEAFAFFHWSLPPEATLPFDVCLAAARASFWKRACAAATSRSTRSTFTATTRPRAWWRAR